MSDWTAFAPPHWVIRSLGRSCRVATGDRDTIDAQPEGHIPFYVRSAEVQRIDVASASGEAILTPGDGAVGEIFHHHKGGAYAAHQRVYVIDHFAADLLPRFFYWYFSATFGLLTRQGTAKSTVDSLRRPMFTSFPVLLPPLPEQRVIADYLDRETAKIDALIAKQNEMIGTLRERRNWVVESSLNPPDELGSRLPLKRALLRVEQGFSPDTAAGTDDAPIWVLKSGATNHGVFRASESKPIPVGTMIPVGIEVRSGDLIVSRASGSPGLVASAAIADVSDRRVVLSDKNFRLIPTSNGDRRYLYWALNAPSVRSQVLLAISGAEGLANNIPLTALRRLRVLLPPVDEQREIADYLDRETAKIDTLIAKVERHIELAKERRSALITAAVTGQIDVTKDAA